VTDKVLDGWRGAKQYASAALASGKLVLMEQRIKKLEEDRVRQKQEREEEKRRRQKQRADEENVKRIQARAGGKGNGDNGNEEEGTLFASNIGELPGEDDNVYDNDHFVGDDDHIVDNIGAFSDDDDDEDFPHLFDEDDDDSDDDQHDELEQELQHVQNKKTYSALLSAIQMEALWKITKIELDRTIREACRWILEPAATMMGDRGEEEGGWYAFCPSPPPPPSSSRHHTHHQRHDHRHHRHSRRRPEDGWVGTTGDVVPMEVGRLRAAAAMILVGDIMVECSKEGTSWNK